MNQKSPTNWNDDEEEREHQLQHERQHVPEQLRAAEQRQDRRGVDDLADHHGDDAIQNSQISIRQMRNLVQSEIRRWVIRSKPPKTVSVQNL